MFRCGIVILAAGASARLGVAKQALVFEGSTLLLRAVNTALESQCRPVVVVLGSGAQELEGSLAGRQVEVVINREWSTGMGSSIRAGVSTIRSGAVDAAVISLCDQPLVSAEMLDRLVRAHFAGGKAMTAAFYAGALGTPVVFSAAMFEGLLTLEDGQGGKTLLKRYPDQVQAFGLPEAEMDVDYPEDVLRLREMRGREWGK